MAFGNAALPTVQYAYDLKGQPHAEPDAWIGQQLYLAHQYRNTLVRLKLDENKEIEDWRIANHEGYRLATERRVAAEAEIEAIFAAIRAQRVQDRERSRGTPEQQDRITQLRGVVRECNAAVSRIRREVKALPGFADLLADLDRRYNGEREDGARNRAGGHRKNARAAAVDAGLHWGTYLAVESSLARESFPQFHSWHKKPWSQLAIQFQSGSGRQMTWERACSGEDRRLRIIGICDKPNGNRIVEVVAAFGQPVRFRFNMHRPIPADARITWMHLNRREIRPGAYRWSVNFTMARAAGWAKDDVAIGGCCAVDYNWRALNGEIRIATWKGEPFCPVVIAPELQPYIRWDADSNIGTVFIDRIQFGRLMQVRGLCGIRDTNYNTAHARLVELLGEIEMPAPLGEFAATLPQWKSQYRLASFYRLWRENRFPGDEAAFAHLANWWHHKDDRAHDHGEAHLLAWQTEAQRGWYAWRKWLYRNLAAILRRSYGTIYLEGGSKAELARIPDPDEEHNELVRVYRTVAASGEMVACIKETCGRFVEVDPACTSKNCFACGRRTALTHQRLYTCEHCGAVWDCDENACDNILARGQAIDEQNAVASA